MTTRFGIATIAAVSSTVLMFGNTAHAEGPSYLGNPLSLKTSSVVSASDISALKPVSPVPTEITSPISVQTPPSLLPAPKFDKMPDPTVIASQMAAPAAPAVIRHAVTDPSNTYVWGQCTWYAKSKRPDLPNGLGNGGQWVGHAAARGFATGSTPRAGAIGEESGHVVYVESVNSNGTVNISEMNYNGGVGVVHTRTTPASEFTYIY